MTRWDRPGLPGLSNLAGPIQHFRSAILDAWRNKVAVDLCARRGFRGGPLLDIPGSHQLLNSSHVRERDKALLRSIMVGGVWNGFLLGKVRGEAVPCRFCGGADGDGHLFWDCSYPPLVEIRVNPEFHDLMRMDKRQWPRCLLWHGWLPLLSGTGGHLGLFLLMMLPSIGLRVLWVLLPLIFSIVGMSPKVLTGILLLIGCLLLLMFGLTVVLFRDEVSGSAFAGAGVCARLHVDNWRYWRWGHFDDLGLTPDGLSSSCVGFSSLPGPLQSVQRAEFWCGSRLAGHECCSSGC